MGTFVVSFIFLLIQNAQASSLTYYYEIARNPSSPDVEAVVVAFATEMQQAKLQASGAEEVHAQGSNSELISLAPWNETKRKENKNSFLIRFKISQRASHYLLETKLWRTREKGDELEHTFFVNQFPLSNYLPGFQLRFDHRGIAQQMRNDFISQMSMRLRGQAARAKFPVATPAPPKSKKRAL